MPAAIDAIFERIGPFGPFQWCSLLLIGSTSMLAAMTIYATIFVCASPELICSPNVVFNATTTTTTATEAAAEATATASLAANVAVDTCSAWRQWSSDRQAGRASNWTCRFDTTHYGASIITEWELVCERSVYASLAQTVYMLGSFSSLLLGYFSDRYGRKRVCRVTIVSAALNVTLAELLQLGVFALSTRARYAVYAASLFVTGVLINCLYAVSYTLLLELTTQRYSTLVSNVNLYMYVGGELLVLAVAHASRSWHVVNWTTAACAVLIAGAIVLFLPESPRYLVQRRRYDEARAVFARIARLNGRAHQLPSSQSELFGALLLLPPSPPPSNSAAQEKQPNTQQPLIAADGEGNGDGGSERLLRKTEAAAATSTAAAFMASTEQLDLEARREQELGVFGYVFYSRANVAKTLMLLYIWIAISLTYYGVSLGITSVGNVNPYTIYLVSSLAEAVGYFACHLNDVFGVKRMFAGFLAASSVVCLAVALVPSAPAADTALHSVLLIALASVGKACVSATFNSAYIYTSEHFPTSVRNTMILFISSVGRTGSILSPSINQLRTLVWTPLPYFVFSGSAVLAGLFVCLLPDPATLGYL